MEENSTLVGLSSVTIEKMKKNYIEPKNELVFFHLTGTTCQLNPDTSGLGTRSGDTEQI